MKLRIAAVALLTFFLVTSCFAGPPLLCHPFDIGNAKSLPWTGTGWNLSGNENYDTKNLAHDTIALLDANTSVIVHMETLRRATLYARKDPQAGKELLTKLHARATGEEAARHPNAMAWFDVGYLAETYQQGFYDAPSPAAGLDGYALVKKALAVRNQDPEMEFAAALITLSKAQDEHQLHTQIALAGAKQDSLLARNLANHYRKNEALTVADVLSRSTSETAQK